MQKKNTGSNKKVPTKGISNENNKNSTIFNYDLENSAPKEKNKSNQKIEEPKTIKEVNTKRLNKIKKQKKKSKNKINKEIKKQEKLEKKQRISREKKLTPKQIKKRVRNKKIATCFFLLILIIVAITLFLLSPIFNISKIEVNGNEKISSDEITSLSRIVKGMNLFSINKRQTAENIKENPYIENVKISRKPPMTLQITVQERNIEFLLEYGSSYAYIDKNGYILEISAENIVDKPKLRGYKTSEDQIQPRNRLCKEDLENINVVSSILRVAENYSLKQLITSINISDDSNYVLYLESEKKTVNLGTTDNIEIKMLYLQSIIEREKDKEGIIFLNVDFKNKYPYGRYN